MPRFFRVLFGSEAASFIPRSRKGPDIDNKLDVHVAQQLDKFIEVTV